MSLFSQVGKQKRTPHEAVSSFLLRILSGSVTAALAVLAILFQFAHDGFRVDALTAVVVGQSSLDSLLSQNRAVHLDRGRPSRASTTALLVSFSASSTVLPLIRSVAMLLVAMAAPQPKVRNLTSTITLFSIFRYMRMMSPHLGLPTSPTPFASGSSPTLCGFAKCSMTLALYILAIITVLPSG